MYELFELVRLLSVRRQSTRQGPVEISRYAWRENGESSLIALLCSNDQLLLRWSVSGRAPIIKQLPWAPEKRVAAMCLDPTVAWLLVVTETPCLYILPALALLDPAARVDQLWSLDDCTVVPVSAQGTLCAACWWHTLDDKQVAVVATKVGELLFVDLLTQKILSKVTTDIQVTELSLIQDDSQMNTSLLMTGVSSGQWKLLLEARPQLTHFSPDSELSSMGYIDIDTRTMPPCSVLDSTAENNPLFVPEKVTQSQPWVMLKPQYARGRHFITAHDQKGATLQVYDSEGQHSPLFVYKLPPGAESVILTDRLTFTLSRRNGSQLLVLSNQRAETSTETLQDFNEDAVIQRLELPVGERLMGACHRQFPFYWHDKQEEQQRTRLRQGTVLEQPTMETVAMEPQAFAIPVTSHTVLDGCIVVTDTAVYECRPRASPERLFLQHAIVTSEMGVAEHLAISVGLDITMLAELAAHFLLKAGHVSRAIRLFAVSKCSQSKRCASLARYGHVQEMVILLKHALQNQGLELSSKERKVLADMLLHCYVHTVAHQSQNVPQTVAAFREFLLGSFFFDEDVALNLLAEHGLTSLLFDFAMARGLVVDALERLVKKGQLPVSLNFLTQLVTRGFSAHVLQAAQGGVLCSMLGEDVVQVLASRPELVTHNAALLKTHLSSLDPQLLLQLATVLDPSQGPVKHMVQRQMQSLHRRASLTSLTSLVSTSSDRTDTGLLHDDGASPLSQILEVFLLTVLYINRHRSNHIPDPLNVVDMLADPTERPEYVGEDETRRDTLKRHLSLQFSHVACGTCHAAVIRDGDLYTWGRTKLGRLGHGDLVRESTVSTPACVQAFQMLQIRVEAVSCGGQHTLAITQQGVYGWGNSLYGQVGVGTRHVYHRPMLLESLLSETCVAISCGQYHSLALTADSRVFSWGWGVHGQLGHGDPEDRLTPECIVHLNGRSIIRVAGGYCHSLALTEMGEVWSFGCGYFGQLGLGSSHKRTLPAVMTALTEPVIVISTKYFHCVAVTVNNRVYSWGCHPHNLRYAASVLRRSRQQGQQGSPMGDGMDLFHLPAPVETMFIHSRIMQVCCGSLHSLLLTVDGEVYVWGRNLEGQLGTGSRQDERVPKMLTRINDQHMIYLCSGGEFNLSLDSDFSLWVWGKNDVGQLGLVKTENQSQAHATPGGHIHWRHSTVMTSDVIVPTPHRGLPAVNIHAQSRWYSSGAHAPSAMVNMVEWVEERGSGDDGLSALPNLQALCTADLPYQAKVIPIVVKALGDYLDRTAILRHCVDQRDWFTAAHLCLLHDRHTQALCYRLLGLSEAAPHLQDQSLADLSSQVVAHHLRLAIDAGGSSIERGQELTTLCTQAVNHWLEHQLPMSQLQHLMEPHLSDLAPHLATLLFRCRAPSKGGEGEAGRGDNNQFYCHHFTSQFCLRVLGLVLSDQSPATDQLLSTWLQASQSAAAAEKTADDAGKDRPENAPVLTLQPKSHLIPYQRLWQDIVRNVAKSSSSANTITLTRSQLDHLQTQVTENRESDGSSDVDAGAVVLFTCGHHFTQSTFTNVVLANTVGDIGAGSSHLAVGKLPSTAALLQQYYTRQGFLPLACPKCVLNALRAQ